MKRFVMKVFLSVTWGFLWISTMDVASARETIQFDFETGDLQGWQVLYGDFPQPVRKNVPDWRGRNLSRAYGDYLLSTMVDVLPFWKLGLPSNAYANRKGGIIESPIMIVEGSQASFNLRGSGGQSVWLALYLLDGTEVRRARPSGNLQQQWDLSDLQGEQVYMRLVDHPDHSYAYVLFDNFALHGSIDKEATVARRQRLARKRQAELAPVFNVLCEMEEIVFAVREPGKDEHWYANFGHWSDEPERKLYGKFGKLCRLNVRSGKLTTLLADPEGTVRDPQVHYNGETILFSYRPGGTEYFHLYEIHADGTGMRQLTNGPYDDIEPTYLPDGNIMFCSSRCQRWVNCFYTEVAILYQCDADGDDIRPVSANIEHDNHPWPLPDGRILHTRWEYVDRSQLLFHHLWTMNPDGSGQMVFFGNLHGGDVMIDAKSIPGSDQVVLIMVPGHGRTEHVGPVVVVNGRNGPDDLSAVRYVSWEDTYRDPYPLRQEGFLVAQDSKLVVMSNEGDTQTIFELPPTESDALVWCHEPRPLVSRQREPIIPPRVTPADAVGHLILADIYHGRKMAEVPHGSISHLLVLETLPKPVNFSGGPQPISNGGTFTLERIVGTVPVESDGSAYLELPALRSFFFVALDKNARPVKRMHSFLAVQPGEVSSCVGCHEHRTNSPRSGLRPLQATNRAPSRPKPVADVPEVFDFPRDIQPILDRYCISCHDYTTTDAKGPRAGGVILTGDRGPVFSHSYITLLQERQISHARNARETNFDPYAIGSITSALMQKIDGSHYGVRLTEHEQKMIRLWIDTGAVYAGTYAALGSGMLGPTWHSGPTGRLPFGQPPPESQTPYAELIERRCNACHEGRRRLPLGPQERSGSSSVRHLGHNLTRPEYSLMLQAPLTSDAGGFGICQSSCGRAVFKDKQDPDYQRLLSLIRESKALLDDTKRFDMVDFLPNEHYVREMKRYGIIPASWDYDDPLDVYAIDRAYWKSLWYNPAHN